MSFVHDTIVGSARELAYLIKKTKCVIIKFSAKWCNPCQNKEFKHNYEMLKQEFSVYPDIKFVELDLDEDDEIVNSTKYYDFAIKTIPHFKFCFEGDIISQYDGPQSLKEIYINLKKVVKLIENNSSSTSTSTSTSSSPSPSISVSPITVPISIKNPSNTV